MSAAKKLSEEMRIDMFVVQTRYNQRVRDGVIKTVENPKRERIHAHCIVEAHTLGLTETYVVPAEKAYNVASSLTVFLPHVRKRLVEEFRPNNIVRLRRAFAKFRSRLTG